MATEIQPYIHTSGSCDDAQIEPYPLSCRAGLVGVGCRYQKRRWFCRNQGAFPPYYRRNEVLTSVWQTAVAFTITLTFVAANYIFSSITLYRKTSKIKVA